MNVSITCMGSATLKLCPFCCHISFSMNILLEKGRVPSATPVDWFLTLGDNQAVSLPQMEVHSIVFGHCSDYATPELPSLYAKPFDRFVQIATSWCESVKHYELVFWFSGRIRFGWMNGHVSPTWSGFLLGESGLDGLVPPKKPCTNCTSREATGRICQPVHIGVALEVGGDGIAFSLKKTGSGKIFGFFGILCWWFGGLEVSMKSSNLWSETAW